MRTISPNFLRGFWGNSEAALGMIHAPGKFDHTLCKRRNMRKDLTDLRNLHHMDVLVSLLETRQMEEIGISDQFAFCQQLGVKTIHFPIEDRSTPKNLNHFKNLIKSISNDELKERQRRIICHCHAGLGRTGLFAASILVFSKYPPEQAIKIVRQTRKGTIQMRSQEEFIKQLSFD